MYHLSLFVSLSFSLFYLFPCVSGENKALCDVYQSTSIADRLLTGHMTGWECFGGEPDAELCEDWSGVKCDRRGNVKYLDISGQNLTGGHQLHFPYILFTCIERTFPLIWVASSETDRNSTHITGKARTLTATFCGF